MSDTALKRCQGAEMTTNNGPLTRNNDGSPLCDRLTLFCHLIFHIWVFSLGNPIHAQYTTMDFDENCGFQKIVFVTPSYGSKIINNRKSDEHQGGQKCCPMDSYGWNPMGSIGIQLSSSDSIGITGSPVVNRCLDKCIICETASSLKP